MNTTLTPSTDDVFERGIALYENHLKEILERDYFGKVVAIHPDSGDYAIGADSLKASLALRERHHSGLFFIRRIGPPTAGDRRFAARVAASDMKQK